LDQQEPLLFPFVLGNKRHIFTNDDIGKRDHSEGVCRLGGSNNLERCQGALVLGCSPGEGAAEGVAPGNVLPIAR
jgi:hypothetical protein